MAYSKQTWHDLPDQTTPINAEKLNHMEDGIFNNSSDIANKLVNEYSTSEELGYVCDYINNALTIETSTDTSGSNQIRYYKFGSLVIMTGLIVMNAQTITYNLKYTPKYAIQEPATGKFQNEGNIAGYGYIKLTAGSKATTIYMTQASTFAVVNIAYMTDD